MFDKRYQQVSVTLFNQKFSEQVGPVRASLLSVIFDGRFGFGYFVGGPDRTTGKQ